MKLLIQRLVAERLWILAVLLLPLYIFLPSLEYDFLNWDDHEYIHRNPWLLSFSLANAVGMFVHPYFANYHPLTMLSYLVDYHLWGLNPAGWRAVNIVLHAVTCVLVYLLLRSFAARPLAAALVAALFAIHPLRIESVVWISERKDVLCGLFMVGALGVWRLADHGGRRPRRRWLVVAMGLFVLALLSKAMAVTVPVLWLLHDVLLRRGAVKGRVGWYIAGLALSLLFARFNLAAQTEAISAGVPLVERIKIALWAPVHYLGTTLGVIPLSPLYPNAERPVRFLLPTLLGAAVCAGGLGVVVACWRRRPEVSFGLLAAAVALGPVSGLVSFGAAYAADRYSYVPTVLLACGLVGLLQRVPPRWLAAAAIPLLGLSIYTTMRLMPAWRDSVSLWDRVLAIYPQNSKAKFNRAHGDTAAPQAQRAAVVESIGHLGGDNTDVMAVVVHARIQDGDTSAALAAARAINDRGESLFWQMRALRAAEDHAGAAAVAREYLPLAPTPERRASAALTLALAGDIAGARAILEPISVPTFSGARAWGTIARRAHDSGDDSAAEAAARRALAIHPAQAEAYAALGEILIRNGRVSELIHLSRRARRHPDAAGSTRAMAGVLELRAKELSRGARFGDDAYAAALAVNPSSFATPAEHAAALNYRAWLAELVRRPALSMRLYRAALEIDPQNVDALQNLAVLLVQSAPTDAAVYTEAIALLERALAIRPGDTDLATNLALMRRDRDRLANP